MKLLALYWGFMIIAYLLAMRLKKKSFDFSWVQPAMMGTIYVLCFIMGLRMGINEEVTSSLGTIGVMSIIITIFCVAGSMAAITLTRKILGMDRFGNLKGRKQEVDETGRTSAGSEENSNSENIKTTIIILVLVFGGMAIGAFVIAGKYASGIETFDSVSSTILVVMLCILLFFVGFELGSKGNVLGEIKRIGFRIFAFPVAAIIGTVLVGTVTCVVMGFTIKEGLAICSGFGWYTYAPVVIAGAGKQYIVASAVSFMHNVIREMGGIIMIPLLAKKFGYIESTGVPGVAAMDVCMPIVERSCRPDTVIYSFAVGIVMCIYACLSVPIIMGF